MQSTIRLLVSVLSVFTLLSACSSTEKASYSQNVKPILDKHCAECHLDGGAGLIKSGFNIGSYQGLMTGTKFGPVITAGDSVSSTLVVLVEGRADPSLRMPHGDREQLSKQEIKTIRDWIDQGAENN